MWTYSDAGQTSLRPSGHSIFFMFCPAALFLLSFLMLFVDGTEIVKKILGLHTWQHVGSFLRLSEYLSQFFLQSRKKENALE